MPESAGTIELIALEISRPLRRLESLFAPEQVLGTLQQFGVTFTDQLLQNNAFENARRATTDAAHGLAPLVEGLGSAIGAGNAGDIIAKGLAVIAQSGQIVKTFEGLRAAIQTAGPGLPGITPAQITDLTNNFASKLFDLLLVDHLDTVPAVGSVLTVLGIVEREFHAGVDGDPTKPDYETVKLRLDQLSPLLSNPLQHLDNLYNWGSPGFDGQRLFRTLHALIARTGLPTRYIPPAGPESAKLEAFAVDMAVDRSVSPPGLQLDIEMPVQGNLARVVDLPHPAWTLDLRGSIVLDIGGTARIRPPLDISIEPPEGSLQGTVEVKLLGAPQSPFILIGQTGGSRLEIGAVEAGMLLRLEWNTATGGATLTPGVSGDLKRGKLVIDTSNSDGFIATILSGFKIESAFDVGLAWDIANGLQFKGSATLEIALPAHIALGPVEIQAFYLIFKLRAESIPVEIATDIKAQLGPLAAVVSRMGVGIDVSFPAGGGNAGPIQLDFFFKPPNGVGLSIDTGVVKGGGFLFIDADRGEYAGALELSLFQVVTIKAVGLITTKMPDGSPGFSLLIIMSVEFGTGIQLGFGFTLLAVGGLLGLNRTMNLQALADGIRSGAIESVMFPRDIIANAPKIISDLKAFFPLLEGTFLIGPMVKLGWGTPTLVSVSLGIIIEIPGNIAIVGILQVALPTADAALIKLQVNFIGAIEFDKKRIWFFAALFDSRVLFLTIEGEMGLLVAFGDDANFVVSVGGFHPRFSPPPLPFPSPRRIAISILNTPVARVRVEGYFAVTSNTVQFGARVEVFFGLDVINVQGHLAFDALFQFSPFYFVIEISASLSVNVFGIGLFSVSLRGSLEGPAPWHIEGHGSITLLFFDIGVDFSETWGENKKEELPPISVLTLIDGELGKAENWRAFLPQGTSLMVSMRKMPEEEAALILHPVGLLRISQRAVPLDLKLDKIGSRKPSDVNRLSLTVIGGGLAKKADALEQFAPAQYQNFKDADKLSKPAFAPEHAGLDLSASGHDTRSSFMVRRAIRYEEIIIDSNFKRFSMRFRGYFGVLFNFFLNGAAVTKCEISRATKKKLQPFDDKIAVQTESYTVAFQSNNKAFSSDATTFHSEASARDYLNTQIAVDPSLAEQIHVIPSFEKAA